VAFPFTTGATAAANLRNSVNNFRGTLLVAVPLVLLPRGYFRVAVAILMSELFLFAFNTFYPMGMEGGWSLVRISSPNPLPGLLSHIRCARCWTLEGVILS